MLIHFETNVNIIEYHWYHLLKNENELWVKIYAACTFNRTLLNLKAVYLDSIKRACHLLKSCCDPLVGQIARLDSTP